MEIQTMKSHKDIATFLMRLALAVTFLSAVGSRLSLWGAQSAGWDNFLAYAADVNSFARPEIVPFLAISATVLEITFSVLLLVGYKTQLVAYGASALTLLFALAMGYSFGIKNPLDYSVFVVSAGAFLLGAVPIKYKWSLDDFLDHKNQNQ